MPGQWNNWPSTASAHSLINNGTGLVSGAGKWVICEWFAGTKGRFSQPALCDVPRLLSGSPGEGTNLCWTGRFQNRKKLPGREFWSPKQCERLLWSATGCGPGEETQCLLSPGTRLPSSSCIWSPWFQKGLFCFRCQVKWAQTLLPSLVNDWAHSFIGFGFVSCFLAVAFKEFVLKSNCGGVRSGAYCSWRLCRRIGFNA